MRIQACEKMGWTFKQFDETPAKEIMEMLEVWKVLQAHEAQTSG